MKTKPQTQKHERETNKYHVCVFVKDQNYTLIKGRNYTYTHIHPHRDSKKILIRRGRMRGMGVVLRLSEFNDGSLRRYSRELNGTFSNDSTVS